jgi:arylsulfatase A-like enzyme
VAREESCEGAVGGDRCRGTLGGLCFGLTLAALAVLSCGAQPPRTANVVLIVVDTLRADRLGVYGADRDTSPMLDELARRSVVFERAYAPASWTKPSVASILTGLYPSGHRANGVATLIDAGIDTLPEILAERGFGTVGIISHMILRKRFGFARGFERWDQSEARGHDWVSTEGVTELALSALDTLAHERRPFFLFLHYFDPHYNYLDHEEVSFASSGAGRLDGSQKVGWIREMSPAPDAEEVAYLRDLYDEEVRHTDAGIGRVLARLEESGASESTVVVVTADHGEEIYERDYLGHTESLHEEVVRVPLILYVPGAQPRSVEVPVSLVSIVPTLLDLLGHDATQLQFEAPSLGPIIRGEDASATSPAPVFVELDLVDYFDHRNRSFKKAIITQDFKLIRDDEARAAQLYRIRRDPREQEDIASRNPEVAQSLSDAIDAHGERREQAASEVPTLPLSEEELEQLEALGYVRRPPAEAGPSAETSEPARP